MYYELSATTSPAQIDFLSELLFAFGAETVTFTDAKDEPLFQLSPEDQPHWKQTTVNGLFVTESRDRLEEIIVFIKNNYAEFSASAFSIKKIEDKNWVEESQKHFHAQQFGTLWVCPQWEKEAFLEKHAREKCIFIEPGLAFGTGTHPTTQLCLTWLAMHDLKNKIVVDYGCGSGILALAACVSGAREVFATDHDGQALQSTLNNAAYNIFDAELIVRKTNDMSDVKADIVVANILANTLIQLASVLKSILKEKGQLVLSGVLKEDVDRVIAAFQDSFSVVEVLYQDEWSLISLSALC